MAIFGVYFAVFWAYLRRFSADVIVEMKQKKHSVFRREGNNLHVEIEISLKEALLGFSKILDHLDDHEVIYLPA